MGRKQSSVTGDERSKGDVTNRRSRKNYLPVRENKNGNSDGNNGKGHRKKRKK